MNPSLDSTLRVPRLAMILVVLVSSALIAQADSSRAGIHQVESELHRWDVLRTHPSVPELQSGAELARAGDFKAALRAFQKAAPARKSYAYFNLGVLYFETGNPQKALKYFQLSYKARRDSVCLTYLRNTQRLLNERARPR